MGDKGVVCYLDWRDENRSIFRKNLKDLKVEKGKLDGVGERKRGRRSSKREGGKSSGASAIYRRLVLTQDHPPHPPGAATIARVLFSFRVLIFHNIRIRVLLIAWLNTTILLHPGLFTRLYSIL